MDEKLTYTKDNAVPLIDDALKSSNTYRPDKAERALIQRVRSRYEEDMLPYQQRYHDEWDEAERTYETELDSDPLKEAFRVSLSHIVINAGIAEKIDAFADIAVGTQEPQDRNKLPFLEAAKKHALRQAKWDKVKLKSLRQSMIYGFCPIRIYYSRETRKIKQRIPLKKDAGLKLATEDVVDFPYDDIRFEVIDKPRRFLIDDNAKDIDEAEDCALITDVNWNMFRQRVQHDNRYKNVEFVKPGIDFELDVDGADVDQSSEMPDTNNQRVRLLEYWNKATDEYIMIANGVVIRETCLVDDHKELPFAVLHQYRRPHSFYSKGVPKLLESLEELYTSVMRAEARATKLAFPILATQEGASLDTRSVASYPGVVLDGGMDQATLMQLGTVPREVYALKDKIEELVIWLTGINFKQVFGSDEKAVGIAALKKESMMSRINMILRENEADFVIRLGDFLMQDIMQYYPVPRVKRLMENDDVKKMHEDEIIRDEDGKPIGRMEIRKIPLEGMQLKELRAKGSGAFSLKKDVDGEAFIFARPEYIRTHSKLDIRAVRPSAMGASKEARKLTLMELSAHAINVNASALDQQENPETGQMTPVPNPIWNQQYIEEQLAEAHDLDIAKAIFSDGDEDLSAEEEMMDLTEELAPPPMPQPMMPEMGGMEGQQHQQPGQAGGIQPAAQPQPVQ